nr:dynein axonemal intermediate chain 7-like [Parasteatoda tepidariorum]
MTNETGRVSFKTNQFGIIGLLQRKYNNIPYQSWELVHGKNPNSASLIISGMHVSLKIQINKDGCAIENIEQDGKSLFSDSYLMWMEPEDLLKKLLYMGINIIVERDIHKYVEVIHKNAEFENWCYSCMAISCHAFNFYWSRWNAVVGSDQFVLKYNTGGNNEGKYNHVLLTPESAMEIKCTESNAKFCDEPVEGQKYYSNLYNMLIGRNGIPDDEIDFKFANKGDRGLDGFPGPKVSYSLMMFFHYFTY